MAYTFTIETADEFDALAWIADRYTYAEVIYDCLKAAWMRNDNDNDFGTPMAYELSESEAWVIHEAVEAEDGYLTCMGGRLKDEVVSLLGKIV